MVLLVFPVFLLTEFLFIARVRVDPREEGRGGGAEMVEEEEGVDKVEDEIEDAIPDKLFRLDLRIEVHDAGRGSCRDCLRRVLVLVLKCVSVLLLLLLPDLCFLDVRMGLGWTNSLCAFAPIHGVDGFFNEVSIFSIRLV